MRKIVKFFVGLILLAGFPALYLYLFLHMQNALRSLQTSQELAASQLSSQLGLTEGLNAARQNLDQQVVLLRASLDKTEQLLRKTEEENAQLRDKIDLLDQVSELEQTITRLKEKNALMINRMSSMETSSPYREKSLRSMKEAKALMGEYRKKIGLVKKRMRVLQKKERDERLAAAREEDKKISMLGNNGYVVREGQICPMEISLDKADRTYRVDVQFVK